MVRSETSWFSPFPKSPPMNTAPLGTMSSTHGSLGDMSYHNSVGKFWAVNLENAGLKGWKCWIWPSFILVFCTERIRGQNKFSRVSQKFKLTWLGWWWVRSKIREKRKKLRFWLWIVSINELQAWWRWSLKHSGFCGRTHGTDRHGQLEI